eukprot:CAMPEP_0197034772 /NCGR_PEP_ID=MMETSP1384-20130603/12757_1 /TAXON_ID=29189 /ORGANISM="Ammonia sp." /LENGTH=236 /DNA_ID=CAMNT_0042464727 /DNA_START=316 /DNA_END=1026 /DNA_ORIENTATION=-
MAARDYLNGTKLDDRIIRADLDPGFEPGRQFGRGATGGQVRDDRRHEYDEGRGGLPPKYKQRLEKHAITSGALIGPTSGPLNSGQHPHHSVRQHRYEQPKNGSDSKQEEKSSDDKTTKAATSETAETAAVTQAATEPDSNKTAETKSEAKEAENKSPDNSADAKNNNVTAMETEEADKSEVVVSEQESASSSKPQHDQDDKPKAESTKTETETVAKAEETGREDEAEPPLKKQRVE